MARTIHPGVAAELVHTVRITVHPQLRKIMQYDRETTVCRGVARFQQGVSIKIALLRAEKNFESRICAVIDKVLLDINLLLLG